MVLPRMRSKKKRFPTTITVVSTHVGSEHKSHEEPKLPTRRPIPNSDCYGDDDIMEIPYALSCFPLFVPAFITVIENQDDDASEISMDLIPERTPSPCPHMRRKTLQTYPVIYTSNADEDWPSDEEVSVHEKVKKVAGFFSRKSLEASIEASICGWPCSPLQDKSRKTKKKASAELVASRDDVEGATREFESCFSRERSLSSSGSSFDVPLHVVSIPSHHLD